MAELNHELISGMLLNLPVKSLLRFRCLSRTLRMEIDGAAFINAHSARSIQTNNRCKLVFGSNLEDDIYSVDVEEEEGRIGRAIKLLNNPFKAIGGSLEILSSCNGLLLLLYGLDDIPCPTRRVEISLWNPSTMRYKKLTYFPDYSACKCCNYPLMGLGYDSATNDHKVVMIHKDYTTDGHDFVSVFSLASNAWRKLQVNCPEILDRIHDHRGMFAHGALHWFCLDYKTREPSTIRILSFHLSKEEFLQVIPPIQSSITTHLPSDFSLHVLRPAAGKLFLHEQYDRTGRGTGGIHIDMVLFELIKKNGDDDGFDWKRFRWLELKGKHFNPSHLKLLGLSEDGNKILMQSRTSTFIWYDVEHGSYERVKIRGVPSSCCYYNLHESVLCWESLVSPGPNSEFDGGRSPVPLDQKVEIKKVVN